MNKPFIASLPPSLRQFAVNGLTVRPGDLQGSQTARRGHHGPLKIKLTQQDAARHAALIAKNPQDFAGIWKHEALLMLAKSMKLAAAAEEPSPVGPLNKPSRTLSLHHPHITMIDQMIAEGIQDILICVWHENQRVPAKSYLESLLRRAQENYPRWRGKVDIVVNTQPGLRTGEIRGGKGIIRYHHS